jgi:primary-amine oxidase
MSARPLVSVLAGLALFVGSLPLPGFAPEVLAAPARARPQAAAHAHPLDPLGREEVLTAAQLVRAHPDFPEGALFPVLSLEEPPKEEVLAYEPGTPFRREALAVVLDRKANRTFEARVDLRARKVLSWKELPGVQPLVLIEEYETVPKIVKADPRWQDAMRRRGITDFDRVQVDTWAAGHLVPQEAQRVRVLRAISYLKDGAMNFYGRPIEGVITLVDMNSRKVMEVVDTGVVPIAATTQEFDRKSLAPLRKDLKPLSITQPKGVSFEVRGHEVRWQKWRLRFALHPREGLVLYTVGYEDQGQPRPILYRASISEMVVPYGDTDGNWAWRNAFDAGEYGVGRLAAPLERNRDAPPNAVYFDAVFSDDFGKPYVMKDVVALYEQDAGLLWKHYDIYSQKNETRRGRQLVLSSVAAIGNYDYGFSWILHQDGTLEVRNELTGIMLPKGVAARSMGAGHEEAGSSGHLVAPNIVAPHHQHFFSYRLDFDVDGTRNSVLESNTEALPAGEGNPFLNGMRMTETPLRTEAEAQRDMSMAHARKWLVVNPGRRNALGGHPGYLLVPAENTVPYAHPESGVRKRAGFLNHHFWATRYRAEEQHAAGLYPNQGRVGEGLATWAADGEGLENEDVVVWYTLGTTHIPRPEEWPVMPAARVGFKLLPAGFFTRNPALDVP